MKLVVHDACILIDLIEGSLLDCWSQLEIVPLTTDLVLSEITDPRQRSALLSRDLKQGLIVEDLTSEELPQVIALQSELGRGLTLTDCSALYQTAKHSAILLTGDGKLRKVAEQKGLTAHGALWILDSLVGRSLIARQLAAQKLKAILDAGSHLPRPECEKRLKTWQ